ncbi:MAG: hypothetical protein JSV04_11115, partial [Candidatus Heimdallarchaeota archaeon]
DGGISWELLVTNLTNSYFVWPTLTIDDASTYMLKVIAALPDGTTIKESYSYGFITIANFEDSTSVSSRTSSLTVSTFSSTINPLTSTDESSSVNISSGWIVPLVYLSFLIVLCQRKQKE